MAACHEPVCPTTWNATTAFNPMPGASAIGKFAPSPMSNVQMAAAAAVAAAAASNGTPAAARIAGLANRMYAIVRNVVTPPRTSRAVVVPRAWRSKYIWGRRRILS